jgi:hypothetical protein
MQNPHPDGVTGHAYAHPDGVTGHAYAHRDGVTGYVDSHPDGVTGYVDLHPDGVTGYADSHTPRPCNGRFRQHEGRCSSRQGDIKLITRMLRGMTLPSHGWHYGTHTSLPRTCKEDDGPAMLLAKTRRFPLGWRAHGKHIFPIITEPHQEDTRNDIGMCNMKFPNKVVKHDAH